jgi:hypothetical protein
VKVDGWYSREEAIKEIKASRERFDGDEKGPHTDNPTEAN